MANEWTRLTPEDVLDIAPVEYGVLERRWHLLQAGCADFALTPGELLALVIVTEVWREVAEVKMVVELTDPKKAMGLTAESTKEDDAYVAGWNSAMARIRKALVAIKEAK